MKEASSHEPASFSFSGEPVKNQTHNSRREFLNTIAMASASTILGRKMTSSNSAFAQIPADEKKAAEIARAARHSKKIASPQWKDGKFQNGLPEHTKFIDAFRKMIFSKAPTTPESEIRTVTKTRKDFELPSASGFRVTWIGHSTLLVELDGCRFLTDPIWGERASPLSFAGPKRFFSAPLPLSELPQIDAVLLSHDHYDHLCRETVESLAKLKIPFITTLGVGDRLEEMGVHYSLIKEFDWWEETTIGDVKIACVPSRHFSGRTPFDRNSTLWCGWVLAGKAQRMYFSGDTAYFPGFKEIGNRYGPFDLVAIESAAYNSAWPDVHIGPEQALQACLELRGKNYLPIHWATFSLATHGWTEPGERLLAGAKSTGVQLVLPRPGESFDPMNIDTHLRKKWWPDLPWETAEQAPVISTGLPEQSP
jgi:L-ascorbate metabolism protein UlaG (beta-lactamase superfamily)